jgi:predicted nucleic acid-binding protein
VTQVLDASAVVAALVDDGPDGRWCEGRLLAGQLVAPHLLPIEAANIIRRTEAHRAIDPSEAAAAVHDLRRVDIVFVDFDSVAERAWELRANLTVYDACYVATAELCRCPLITLDRRLARAPGVRCEVVVAPAR